MGLRESIAQAIRDADKQIGSTCASSQLQYKYGLQPGETMPEFGTWDAPTDSGRADKDRHIANLRAEVDRIIDRELSSWESGVTASANANDVATVQLALSRESIGNDELQALYDRYKGNHQLAAAIRERMDPADRMLAEPEPYHDADAAKRQAYSLIREHYAKEGGFSASADRMAGCIADAYTHTDALGRTYD